MTPQFQDRAAESLWTSYFAAVDRALRFADRDDARELRSELEAHLTDSFNATDAARSTVARLEEAIARLGHPTDYLRPFLADGLLDRGTRRFRPVSLMRGLYHTLWLGSGRAAVALAFALGYLLLAVFLVMALLKPIWSRNVGLFRSTDGNISFGILSSADGAQELLGWWIMPIALGVCAILYWALNRALRAVRRRA